MEVWGLVLAAGDGARFGGAKQHAVLQGTRLVDRAVETAARACDAIVVVLAPGTRWEGPPVAAVAEGGPTRSASVRAGLALISEDAEIIVIHDSARPLASQALFSRVIEAIRSGADAAIPGISLTDTIKQVEDGKVIATLDREQLVAVQTPQAFRASVIRRAHDQKPEATDDAAVVQACGIPVFVIQGEEHNRKVTTPEDLELLNAILTRQLVVDPAVNKS